MEEIVIPVKTKEGKIERVIIKPEVPAVVPAGDLKVATTTVPTLPKLLPKPTSSLLSAPQPTGGLKAAPTLVREPPSTISRDEVLEPLVASVIAETKVSVGADLQGRLKDALTRRFKDLYDNAELLEFLTKSIVSGGMGMLVADARQVVGLAGSRVGKITEEMRRIELERTRGALKREAEMKDVRAQIRDDRDRQERDMIYEYVTAKVPSTKVQIPNKVQAPIINVQTKPQVRDVASPSPKLVGPIEELGNLTIADFRNLSSDARAACTKIAEKVDLVGRDSYERRAEAIRAWRESEPMRLYSSILSSKLSGTSPPTPPPLTDAEFTAIMELNRNLRF